METDQIRRVLEGAEQDRRAQLLHTLLLVLIIAVVTLSLAAVGLALYNPSYDLGPRLGTLLAAGVVCLCSYALLRRGHIQVANIVFFGGCMILVALIVVLVGFQGPEVLIFFLLIVMAGMMVSGRASLVLAGMSMLVYGGVIAIQMAGWYVPPWQLDAVTNLWTTVSVRLATLVLMGLAGWFFAVNLREALAQAHHQALVTQQKNAELESWKDELEHRVAERTQELTRALETVSALAAPVLPVAQGVIILPLVGHADEARMQRVLMALLTGIRAHRAQIAILDITGLTTIDAVVAARLVDAVLGARLLGCNLVLVGVRAETARRLVDLGIDLSALATQANLRAGLDYALRCRRQDWEETK